MMLYLSNQTCFLFDPEGTFESLGKRKVTVSLEASPYVPNMFKFINKVWTETNSGQVYGKECIILKN